MSWLLCPCEPEHGRRQVVLFWCLPLVGSVGKVFGKGLCGHLIGGSWIIEVFQAVHELTLQAYQLRVVLEIGADPVRCLPGHYLVYQADPRILTDLKCRIKRDLCHGAPLAGGKDTYLLSEPGGGPVCQADQRLKPDHIAVITGPSFVQDLNGAVSLPSMHDTSGPGQYHRQP